MESKLEPIEIELAVSDALIRLAVARGGTLDDTSGDVYVDELRKFDIAFVKRACERLRVQPRREFEAVLPALGTIIETINAIAREEAEKESARKLLPMPKVADENEPRFFCLTCLDSGWEILWCPGYGPQRLATKPDRHADIPTAQCDRLRPHASHTGCVRCSCEQTNPVLARERQKQREFVERRAAK